MRIVILTSFERGFASACLPYLVAEPDIDIALVVLSRGRIQRPWRLIRQKLRKVHRIGLLGMLNGLRLAAWYREDVNRILGVEDVASLAAQYRLRLEHTPTVNSERTADLFREAEADLGLSLGNDYISPRVFSLPRYGMINVHHELLPGFQGAPSVMWQVYERSSETGFTIHQINRHIDQGAILYREALRIEYQPTLRETVSVNTARLFQASAQALADVVKRYSYFAERAQPQSKGHTYTTPSWRQFREMQRRHAELYRAQQAERRAPVVEE